MLWVALGSPDSCLLASERCIFPFPLRVDSLLSWELRWVCHLCSPGLPAKQGVAIAPHTFAFAVLPAVSEDQSVEQSGVPGRGPATQQTTKKWNFVLFVCFYILIFLFEHCPLSYFRIQILCRQHSIGWGVLRWVEQGLFRTWGKIQSVPLGTEGSSKEMKVLSIYMEEDTHKSEQIRLERPDSGNWEFGPPQSHDRNEGQSGSFLLLESRISGPHS